MTASSRHVVNENGSRYILAFNSDQSSDRLTDEGLSTDSFEPQR